MTGKDLILYILQNNLEDIQVFENDFGLDDQGNPIVAGLPWVITLEGGKAKMLDGVEALHILGRLEE